MRPPDRSYVDDRCEVRLSLGEATIHDRATGRYYRAPVDGLPLAWRRSAEPVSTRVPTWVAPTATALTAALFVVNLSLLPTGLGAFTAATVPLLALYLGLSVGLHEAAHVVALRVFGRRIDGVGFKMNHWVFPAFYVRMNQSRLIGRPEQVVVHGAGAAANLAMNALLLAVNALWLGWDVLTSCAHFVFVSIAWNLVPVLGSDGYRILLAVTGTQAARSLRNNPVWLIALKIVSVGLAIVAGLRLITLVWSTWFA